MISDTTIRKLVDYISLNACSVNSSGLYNGKSGISLALFETAKCLQDTEIEDKAFSLFQESLIRKTNDYGFENGSGNTIKRCSNCGYTTTEDFEFCPKCGRRL